MSGGCASFTLQGETYLVERGFEPSEGVIAAIPRIEIAPPDAWLWDDVFLDFYPRQRRLRALRVSTPMRDTRLQSQLRGPGRGAVRAVRLEALRRTGDVGSDASPADGLNWLLQHEPDRVAILPGHYRFAGPAFERRYESGSGMLPGAHARSIAVIVSYRNHSGVTVACLEHLAAQELGAELEVIVIDNRSDAEEHQSVDMALARLFPSSGGRLNRVRHLLFDAPFNLSYQNNLGVALTTAEVVVLLNNDCFMLDPGCLQEIANWALVPGVGTAAPRMLGRGGRLMTAGVNAGIDHGTGAQRLWECEYGPLSKLVRWTAANSTACAAISRSAWHAVGGMDACAFPSQYDDADLCLRMSEAGYRHLYVGTTCVFHEPGTSEPRRQEESARLMRELLERHAEGLSGDWPEFEVFRHGKFSANADAEMWKLFIACFHSVVGWFKTRQNGKGDDAGRSLIDAWNELDAMCQEVHAKPIDTQEANVMEVMEQSRLMLQSVLVCRHFAAFNKVNPALMSALAAIESHLKSLLTTAMNGAEKK